MCSGNDPFGFDVQIAREVGFDVKLVNGENVAKMRQVIFGDFGKTDERDPRAIDAVATHGRTIIARDLPAAQGSGDLRVTATAPQSKVAGCPTSCDR